MKNGNLIFQSIITLAVIALFVLHYTDRSASDSIKPATTSTAQTPAKKFAYVRIDSLANNYKLQSEYREMMFAKGQRIQQDLATREQNVLAERQVLQQAYPSLSAVEQRQAENEYRQIEQAFMTYERRVSAEFQAEEDSINSIIQADLQAAIADLQEKMQFDYVFQYQGTLLYGDSLDDITSALVQRLNAAYQSEE